MSLVRVFPKAIVLTNKPRIDVRVPFTSKQDLLARTIALGKTRIRAIKHAHGRFFFKNKNLTYAHFPQFSTMNEYYQPG